MIRALVSVALAALMLGGAVKPSLTDTADLLRSIGVELQSATHSSRTHSHGLTVLGR